MRPGCGGFWVSVGRRFGVGLVGALCGALSYFLGLVGLIALPGFLALVPVTGLAAHLPFGREVG